MCLEKFAKTTQKNLYGFGYIYTWKSPHSNSIVSIKKGFVLCFIPEKRDDKFWFSTGVAVPSGFYLYPDSTSQGKPDPDPTSKKTPDPDTIYEKTPDPTSKNPNMIRPQRKKPDPDPTLEING